jgi:hypothetical protein
VKAKQHDLFLKATPLTKRNSGGLHILVVNSHLATAESTVSFREGCLNPFG